MKVISWEIKKKINRKYTFKASKLPLVYENFALEIQYSLVDKFFHMVYLYGFNPVYEPNIMFSANMPNTLPNIDLETMKKGKV